MITTSPKCGLTRASRRSPDRAIVGYATLIRFLRAATRRPRPSGSRPPFSCLWVSTGLAWGLAHVRRWPAADAVPRRTRRTPCWVIVPSRVCVSGLGPRRPRTNAMLPTVNRNARTKPSTPEYPSIGLYELCAWPQTDRQRRRRICSFDAA